MVKKVVLSDSNDSDQDDAPQMLTKAQASSQFKSQKLSIKPKAAKKVKPQATLFETELSDTDIQ
jgi:hypothetical protein